MTGWQVQKGTQPALSEYATISVAEAEGHTPGVGGAYGRDAGPDAPGAPSQSGPPGAAEKPARRSGSHGAIPHRRSLFSTARVDDPLTSPINQFRRLRLLSAADPVIPSS